MDINRLSEMAHLKLNKKERDKLEKNLESILNYVKKLKEVNINGVAELTHPVDVVNELRDDNDFREASRSESKKLVDAAETQERGFIKVRKVFDDQD